MDHEGLGCRIHQDVPWRHYHLEAKFKEGSTKAEFANKVERYKCNYLLNWDLRSICVRSSEQKDVHIVN